MVQPTHLLLPTGKPLRAQIRNCQHEGLPVKIPNTGVEISCPGRPGDFGKNSGLQDTQRSGVASANTSLLKVRFFGLRIQHRGRLHK